MSLHRRILLPSGSNGPDLSSPPSRHVPSNVIIAVTSAAAAFIFLAIIYYAVLRHRHRRPPHLFSGHDASASSAAASAASDHPIWHIKTLGLDAATIDSLGSYAHLDSGDRTAAGCAVCLGELLDGEIVRLLPKCSHVFHVQCVDTWLLSHVTCPLCRAAVVDEVPTADVADVDGGLAENPQLEEEEEEEQEDVRVSVVEVAESSGVLRSASMGGFLLRVDEEKEGNCSNGSKEEALEKGQSESGRGFLFSRLGRARSSSVLPF